MEESEGDSKQREKEIKKTERKNEWDREKEREKEWDTYGELNRTRVWGNLG